MIVASNQWIKSRCSCDWCIESHNQVPMLMWLIDRITKSNAMHMWLSWSNHRMVMLMSMNQINPNEDVIDGSNLQSNCNADLIDASNWWIESGCWSEQWIKSPNQFAIQMWLMQQITKWNPILFDWCIESPKRMSMLMWLMDRFDRSVLDNFAWVRAYVCQARRVAPPSLR